jgi:hypothetical protein
MIPYKTFNNTGGLNQVLRLSNANEADGFIDGRQAGGKAVEGAVTESEQPRRQIGFLADRIGNRYEIAFRRLKCLFDLIDHRGVGPEARRDTPDQLGNS